MLRNKPSGARGNAFFFVLLGIALFAALAITITRGMRGNTTARLTSKEVEITATEILEYAQRVERGVNRIRQHNISENDISFAEEPGSDFEHTPPQPAEHNVFDPAGGAVTWQQPSSKAGSGISWAYTGKICVPGIGKGDGTCDSDGAGGNEELMVLLPGLHQAVCQKIDEKLGLSSIPANAGDSGALDKFTGTYEDEGKIDLGAPRTAACFSEDGVYTFYYVLIAR